MIGTIKSRKGRDKAPPAEGRRRATPAMVVSCTALVLAASGAGYAAGDGASPTISACVHHAGGGLYIARSKCARGDRKLSWDAAGPQGATGSAGAPGSQGTPGAQGATGVSGTPATTLYAQVESNATINTSSPGVTAGYSSPEFFVDFGQNISHCVPLVQEGSLPVFGSPGTSVGDSAGYAANVGMAGAGVGEGPGGEFPTADTVSVITYVGSSQSPAPFYIAVIC
ncbi:MAG: hypothetical protein ABSC56_06770 [Solirubrobacteraceae bacterium]